MAVSLRKTPTRRLRGLGSNGRTKQSGLIPFYISGSSALVAFAVLSAMTLFVNLGYLVYIPTTVFYTGMVPELTESKTLYSIIFYAVSIGAIFLHRENYLPKIFTWIFFVLSNLTYYTYYVSDISVVVISTVFFVIFCAISPQMFGRLSFALRINPCVPISLINWCFWVSLLCGFYFLARNGFHINPDLFVFEGVYDVRFEVTGGRTFIENILFSTTTKLFSVLALGYYVHSRNVWRAVAVAFAIALMYSTSAQKSILFFAAITCIVTVGKGPKQNAMIGLGLATGIFALCAIPQVEGSASWAAHSFLTRRLLLIPAWLNVEYVNFFQNSPMYLSHSILNGLFRSYSGPGPTWEMGYFLWGFGTSLNNGVFSDGFMNFGYIGTAVYLFISLGAVLFQLRFVHPAMRAVVLVYIWQLNNSAFITTFITHGLGVFILIGLFLFGRDRLK